MRVKYIPFTIDQNSVFHFESEAVFLNVNATLGFVG